MSFFSNSSAWLRPRNTFLTFLSIALFTFSFAVQSSVAINVPIRLPAKSGFHRIYTCTSFGPDWATLPVNTSNLALQSKEAPAPVNGTYQIGSWPSREGLSVSPSLATLVTQIHQYLSNGFGAVNRPTIIFASYGSTSVGLYIGQGLQSQGVATGNGTFAAVQDALTSWSKAECLTFPWVQNVTGKVPLAMPLYSLPSNASNISVNLNANSTDASPDSISSIRRRRSLAPRATCFTAQVVSGDTCTTLAEKCGITPAQFTKYNSKSKECASLVAEIYVAVDTAFADESSQTEGGRQAHRAADKLGLQGSIYIL
ncbi:hypothetical protein BP00DRAFT_462971 [Aspergillus indologenus CBS 114.80]|uniref:LysM domain-containing protein n=1 Tax=Aspergillus indologenus CBS 114.80 TaxID=1450541 RepID=A0A2V5IE87_9EURO|nr:hypothetical protein BP00DRAFT_462971 [Aspergillus indologenus CBS 114.80]